MAGKTLSRCPYCQCFYPADEIEQHKVQCSDNPNR
jgi:hypothetical protein